MSQTADAVTQTADDSSTPTNAYAAALMEAVRRQPRLSARYEPSAPVTTRATSPLPTTRPSSLPKRPKGRLFMGTILFVICAGSAAIVWNSLFRFQAYGLVTGRLVELSAPGGGVLETVLVREGEAVQQGQLLATVMNHELERRLLDKLDELRIAQAALDAQVGQVRFQAQVRDDSIQRTFAEYYQLWGELLQEQSKLAELEVRRARAEGLRSWELVTEESMDELRFAEEGQRAKIDKLSQAVEEMKLHFKKSETAGEDLHELLRPHAMRVETIQSDLRRLRENHSLKEIRSPANGRVVRVHRFTGEYSDPDQPVLEILVDGSLEAVLYVSQKHTQAFYVGRAFDLHLPSEPRSVKCEVVRVANQYESAPRSIDVHYRRNEKLLPVYTRPVESSSIAMFRLGTEVRLPYEVANPLPSLGARVSDWVSEARLVFTGEEQSE